MNDRIKELAIEAGGNVDYRNRINEPCVLFTEEGFKKFAELIVQECASLTLDYAGPDHYHGWLDYRDEIRKHFGMM